MDDRPASAEGDERKRCGLICITRKAWIYSRGKGPKNRFIIDNTMRKPWTSKTKQKDSIYSLRIFKAPPVPKILSGVLMALTRALTRSVG